MVPGAVPMARQTTGHLARKRKAMGLSVRKGHLGAVGLHERPVKDRLAAVVEDPHDGAGLVHEALERGTTPLHKESALSMRRRA